VKFKQQRVRIQSTDGTWNAFNDYFEWRRFCQARNNYIMTIIFYLKLYNIIILWFWSCKYGYLYYFLNSILCAKISYVGKKWEFLFNVKSLFYYLLSISKFGMLTYNNSCLDLLYKMEETIKTVACRPDKS